MKSILEKLNLIEKIFLNEDVANIEYKEFLHYIKNRKNINEGKITETLKEKINFLKELAKKAKLKVDDLFRLFSIKTFFAIGSAIKWSLKGLGKLLGEAFSILNLQFDIPGTVLGKFIEQGEKGKDKFIKFFQKHIDKHPKFRNLTGPLLAAILFYIYFTGIPPRGREYELALDDIGKAFRGKLSFSDFLLGKKGTDMLTAVIIGNTVIPPPVSAIGIIIRTAFAAVKEAGLLKKLAGASV